MLMTVVVMKVYPARNGVFLHLWRIKQGFFFLNENSERQVWICCHLMAACLTLQNKSLQQNCSNIHSSSTAFRPTGSLLDSSSRLQVRGTPLASSSQGKHTEANNRPPLKFTPKVNLFILTPKVGTGRICKLHIEKLQAPSGLWEATVLSAAAPFMYHYGSFY